MQVTYKEAIAFINVGREFLNSKDRKPSALSYAVSRNIKRLEKHQEEYNDLIADARDKFQKKDKDGVFEYHDEKATTPKFSAENHTAFRKEFNKIRNTSFEYEPYHATSVPSDLELAWYEFFVPIVIPEYPQPQAV